MKVYALVLYRTDTTKEGSKSTQALYERKEKAEQAVQNLNDIEEACQSVYRYCIEEQEVIQI